MKKNLVFAVFLSAILAMTLVLAAFTIENLIPMTIPHGTSATGSFTLNNTEAGIMTGITCSASGAQASWIAFTSCPTTIPASSTGTATFTAAVPEHTGPATYTIPITIQGNIGMTIYSDTKNLLVTVPTASALTITSSTNFEGYPGTSSIENVTLENTGNTVLNNIVFTYNSSNLIDDDGDTITLTFNPTIIGLDAGDSATDVVTAAIPANMDYGTYSVDVTAASGATSAVMHVTIEVKKEFCDSGNQGTRLSITSISEPDKSDEFRPNEEISVEVEVKNSYSEDIDAVLEAQLFDVDDDVYVVKEEAELTISDGSSETLKTSLKVPIDVDQNHHFMILLKVYEDGEEDSQCKDDFVEVDIIKDSNSIIVSSLTTSPTTVECDKEFSMSVKLGNAGRSDEDKVEVRVYNTALGIDQKKTFAINEGDYYTAVFNSLIIPKNAEEKEYTMNIDYSYDYDDSSDEYKETGSAEGTITVSGNCIRPVYDVLMTTEQTSTAKPNEQLTIKVTLTNVGNEKTTYTLSATGYQEWATFQGIDPTSIVLESDGTGYAYVKLTPKEAMTGSKTFQVKASFQGLTETQDITVNVMATSTPSKWLEQLWFSIEHNWEWALVNLALAAAIIVLVVLLLTKKIHPSKGQVLVVRGKGKPSQGPTEINLKSARKSKRKK